MDEKLYKATIEGNLETLQRLIQEDALILHRNSTTTTFLETPLHIAAMLGHEQFATELLRLMPELARELDSQGSSPLHLASAKGHLGIVKACLQVNPGMCSVRNKDGKNPVHVAAMKGRIEVLKELMRVKPDAGRAIVEGDNRSILHLCVECGQLEALKLLMESRDFDVNCKDKNGNTILHLAVADKQTETTDFLLGVAAIDVNALNHKGMTPMDISMQRGIDIRDLEIEETLKRARASTTRENNHPHGTMLHYSSLDSSNNSYMAKKPIKQKDDWLERKKSALMVVASLIATMAFQVGVDPSNLEAWTTPTPQGNAAVYNPNSIRYYTMTMYTYLKSFTRFYVVNTTSFIASLSIIFLLMSGLPIKNNKFFMWILMVITWVAITALALSYTISVILLTPATEERTIGDVIGLTVAVWLCLMALLLIGHTIRLSWRIIAGLILFIWRLFTVKRRRRPTNRGHV